MFAQVRPRAARKRPKRKRTRLATCIFEDKYGISIILRGEEKGNRFPLGTPVEQLIKERDRLREALGPRPSRQHTLRADCDEHLKTLPTGRAHDEQAAICAHWCTAFRDRATLSLTARDIRQQRATWLSAKAFSPKHLNNMLHVLRAVFKTSYPTEPNPAKDVPVLTVKYAAARAIPDALVDLIINGMSDTAWPVAPKKTPPPPNKAKLRLRVMRETGLPQAMLKRVQRHHLNFTAKTVYTEMRLKGRGVEGATLPLTAAGVTAFRALITANALGHFNTRSLAQAWRRAVDRTKAAWEAKEATKKHPRPWPLPADARAYDLRHTFGTVAILETEGDLEAVATLMRHANINTTRRYLQAASQQRARSAVQALNRGGRLP